MVGETGFAPARACAHEFLRLACIHSTTRRKSWCGRGELHAHAPKGAAVFKTARSTVPRTAAKWSRGGRSRTGTGNDAQRGLSPPCLHSNHAAIKWCGQRESHPHELALTGFSLRRVYCFATSAKTGASTGTCALLAVLPRQSVAFYGLDAKWSKRKDSHLRSPEGQRVYSASQLLLCHASKKMGARAGFAPAAFSL